MVKNWLKHNFEGLLTVSILLLIAFFFHNNTFKKLPFGYHVWSKSDHLALTYGFYNNDLDLFHPETFVITENDTINHVTHPGTSITAADISIHSYIPAVLMKVVGEKSPFFHRVYMFLISFLGLFYLFKLGETLTEDKFKAALITVFGFVTPVFLFYQTSFLPSIGAFSLAIIGCYFYFSYLKTGGNRVYTAIFWLTVAGLSRTPFIIPLFAVFGNEVMRMLRSKASVKVVTAIVTSLIILFTYTVYKSSLKSTYGTIFLGELLPPASLAEAQNILSEMIRKWKWTYLSITQWGVFILLSIYTLFHSNKSKRWSYPQFLWIFLLGELAFFFVMMKQFVYHDYYFIDSFLLLFVLFFAYLVSLISLNKSAKKIVVIFVNVVLLLSVFKTFQKKQDRISASQNDNYHKTVQSYEHAGAFLDQQGVSKEAKILALGAYGTNIAFLNMNRKGYFIPIMSKERMQHSLEYYHYDYILFPKAFFMDDVYSQFPEILNQVQKVAANDHLILAKKVEGEGTSLNEFLGFTNDKLKYQAILNSEFTNNWNNLVFNPSDSCYSIDSDMLFGPAHTLAIDDSLFNQYLTVIITADVNLSDEINSSIIFGISSKEKPDLVYENFELREYINQSKTWSQLKILTVIPVVKGTELEAKCYFYNPNKATLFVKNVAVEVY